MLQIKPNVSSISRKIRRSQYPSLHTLQKDSQSGDYDNFVVVSHSLKLERVRAAG
jgi:hypothetical protein